MSRATRSNVGRSMAVIFIEYLSPPTPASVRRRRRKTYRYSILKEEKIISLATIQPLRHRLNGQGESSELAPLPVRLVAPGRPDVLR